MVKREINWLIPFTEFLEGTSQFATIFVENISKLARNIANIAFLHNYQRI